VVLSYRCGFAVLTGSTSCLSCLAPPGFLCLQGALAAFHFPSFAPVSHLSIAPLVLGGFVCLSWGFSYTLLPPFSAHSGRLFISFRDPRSLFFPRTKAFVLAPILLPSTTLLTGSAYLHTRYPAFPVFNLSSIICSSIGLEIC